MNKDNKDLPKLRPKTKAFVDRLVSNPKLSQTQAYLQTHQTNNPVTAKVEASKLLSKPNVKVYKASVERLARQTVTEIMLDKSVKADTRLKASQDILDRNIGKAIQKTETKSTSVNVNLEASKELSDNFTAFLKQQTQQP